jgi:hypothetical protein
MDGSENGVRTTAMPTSSRRYFLRGTLGAGAVAVATAAGLLRPSQVLAEWPAARFAPRGVAEPPGGPDRRGCTDPQRWDPYPGTGNGK